VNDASRTHQACEKLEAMAEALSISSVSLPLSEDMKSAISGCNSYSEKVEDKTIALIVERWPNHKFNGFDLKFLISSIQQSASVGQIFRCAPNLPQSAALTPLRKIVVNKTATLEEYRSNSLLPMIRRLREAESWT
jgi:hypothetical protein